jgi:hypothetical protein
VSYKERNLHLGSNKEEKVSQCQIRNRNLRLSNKEFSHFSIAMG